MHSLVNGNAKCKTKSEIKLSENLGTMKRPNL